MKIHKIKTYLISLVVVVLSVLFLPAFGIADGISADLSSGHSSTFKIRIAPGDVMTFSLKLANFGNQRRADIQVTYTILDQHGNLYFSQTETVAVETTASFVKEIQIPEDLNSGEYRLASSIIYAYQEAPATSEFNFKVEKKFLGIFYSDLILYAAGFVVFFVLLFVFIFWLEDARQKSRAIIYSYSDKPKDQRIYYELISDAIMQMRLQTGEKALEIAQGIPGLTIDPQSGRVLNVSKDKNASEIMGLLVLKFEVLLSRNVELNRRAPPKIESKDMFHLANNF